MSEPTYHRVDDSLTSAADAGAKHSWWYLLRPPLCRKVAELSVRQDHAGIDNRIRLGLNKLVRGQAGNERISPESNRLGRGQPLNKGISQEPNKLGRVATSQLRNHTRIEQVGKGGKRAIHGSYQRNAERAPAG